MSTSERQRVLVAMSGGVDSTLAAALLLEDGRYQVVGVTLRLWPCEEGGAGSEGASCCGQGGVAAAREAAGSLGIRHHVLDCHDQFRQQVLEPAWRDYASGRTPNPCVLCNSAVKWSTLEQHAARLGASFIATGHYARIADGGAALLRGLDRGKDQSYFLFALSQEQLARTLFPLGELTKAEVRQRAAALGLPNADRPDSQDACLGGAGVAFSEALRELLGEQARPGMVVDRDGLGLGDHGGVHRFTIGQRKGLGVATGTKSYVSEIDPDEGRVVLSDQPDDLMSSRAAVQGVTWLAAPRPEGELWAEVQIRYRHRAAPARLKVSGAGEEAWLVFDEPQRAITPGQAAVFYDGEKVLGGGWIRRALD